MINDFPLDPQDQKEVELRVSIGYYIRQFDLKDLKKMKELAISLANKKSQDYFFDEFSEIDPSFFNELSKNGE